ncbi:MAG: hypothetical protein CBE33_05270 [Candidatus Pelagibacter sp. TMED273]|nr:MAG: hypothetical protein CBE33_05270 [Candidatus Pelagibacter sp. TMED273]|tara:strand:- start:2256 stop:2915 length:660 start_codon:yes stop_codon:yes gene_type:complete
MKLDIILPTDLSEITLEQYQKFVKIDTEENKDSSFLMHKTVEIFCNLDLKNIVKIKMVDVKKILAHLNQVFEKKNDLIPNFNLHGKQYGFIPSLDEMTLGEYIDLDETMTDWQKMHKAMGVLYRPIVYKKGSRYKIEEYTGAENNEDFKDMPLNIVMGALVFFWNLNNELLQTTLNYLKKETKETNMEVYKTLQESGDGIQASMDLLKGMFPNMTVSLN